MRMVYLNVQSTRASMMIEAADAIRNGGIDIEFSGYDYADVDDDPILYQRLVRDTKNAQFVFIRCMSDVTRFKRFEKYEQVLKDNNICTFIRVSDELLRFYRDLFKGTDEDFKLLLSLTTLKGKENDIGIINWLAWKLGLRSEPPEPVKTRADGIYHPDLPHDISLEDYLKRLDPKKLTAGLVFSGASWLYNDLEHVDSMIRRLEADGMNVIPYFYQASYRDHSNVELFRKYFTRDGNVLTDVILLVSGLSQLTKNRDREGIKTDDENNFFDYLTGVPILQLMTVGGEFMDFESSAIGLDKNEIVMFAAWPEVDGEIITVPIGHVPAERKFLKTAAPIEERISHVSKVAQKWATLHRTPPSERKVAILMYQSRQDSGRIGNAAGLDVPESVAVMLQRMRDLGYTVEGVPENSKQLITEILDNITNDLQNDSSEYIREHAVDMVSKERYLQHYDKISEFNRKTMEKDWGDPVGEISTDNGKIVIPGLVKGNVYIGYQPLRSRDTQFESKYHDPILMTTHQYLEFYRWLQYDFGTNLVVHMGTHGSLEWLPGKNVGLSGKCVPDMVLDGIPNVYPYVIDDPGEGIQTRRRSESVVIGHMNPTMARGGTYDDLAPVENPLQDYFKMRGVKGPKKDALIALIYKEAKDLDLFDDLGIKEDPGEAGFEPYLEKLHDYITEVKDALIRDGLHVLGRIPREERMDEHIYSIMRLNNGNIRSLRDALAESMGYDMQYMIDHPDGIASDGMLNSMAIDKVDDELMSLLIQMRSFDHDKEKSLSLVRERCGEPSVDLIDSVSYVCDRLAPNLKKMGDEIDNMMDAFSGKYVLPGPSGAPTRGNAHILPMGRNFYGVDPDCIPTPAAWKVGTRMADQMIEKFIDEKGRYPKEVGMIIWATDTMKTTGDDVAYILWLLGVRPIWSKVGGQVTGLEVVPVSELGRPRVDVTVNITGLFRDTFPNLMDLIDDAVKIVADLDESEEDNNIAANLRKDMIEGIASGLTVDEARRRASMRLFGAPPGAYGTGVNHAIASSAWETVEDLADIYAGWVSYAYGRGTYGESMKEQFVKRFSNVEATIKNMPDREIDLVDCDDVYEYLGGMNTFVRAYGKKDAVSIMGDGSNPDKTKVRSTKEELQFTMRSKVLNPKFVEGLKEHGYAGAAVLADITEYVFAWDATSAIVDDWMYERMADRFLFEDETRKWMMEENPYAMMNILNRLHEAIDRGLWDADEEMLQKLQDLYIEVEEKIEEITDHKR